MKYSRDYKSLKLEIFIFLSIALFLLFLLILLCLRINIQIFSNYLDNGFEYVTNITLFSAKASITGVELDRLKKVIEHQIEYKIIIKNRQKRIKYDIVFLIIILIIDIVLFLLMGGQLLPELKLSDFKQYYPNFEIFLFLFIYNSILGSILLYDVLITRWRLKEFGM